MAFVFVINNFFRLCVGFFVVGNRGTITDNTGFVVSLVFEDVFIGLDSDKPLWWVIWK